MIKLTLLVFVLAIIATGYLQELGNSLQDPPTTNEDSGTIKKLWLQQFQGRRNGKPCPRRNNSKGPWIPSYSSRISHPLYHTEPKVLQPQALKNEEFRESQVGTTTENTQLNLAFNRRSYDQSTGPSDLSTDEDCGDQLSAVTIGSSTDPNPESTALKIIEDCLKKKQNNQYALDSSRRSLSNPYSVYNDDNNELRDSDIDDILDGNDDLDAARRKGSSKKSLQDKNTDQQIELGNSLSNLRICYACSTATNPTCWEPDMRTTIKYCRKEQSCVTKTFGVKNQVTLIRDCANSCADTSVTGIEPKYKSCNICHKDYCNSAMGSAINIYSLVTILIISIVKCTY